MGIFSETYGHLRFFHGTKLMMCRREVDEELEITSEHGSIYGVGWVHPLGHVWVTWAVHSVRDRAKVPNETRSLISINQTGALRSEWDAPATLPCGLHASHGATRLKKDVCTAGRRARRTVTPAVCKSRDLYICYPNQLIRPSLCMELNTPLLIFHMFYFVRNHFLSTIM